MRVTYTVTVFPADLTKPVIREHYDYETDAKSVTITKAARHASELGDVIAVFNEAGKCVQIFLTVLTKSGAKGHATLLRS